MANPSDAAAEVTMTYLPEGGAPVTRTHQVPANGRLTVNIEHEDASLANLGAIGTRLPEEITDGVFGTDIRSDVPIAVERAMYSNANGQFWAAGTNAAATRLP